MQETLPAVLQAGDRFYGEASARTWRIGLLKHKVMDMFHRDTREVQVEDPGDLEGGQLIAILQRCLDALPPPAGAAFHVA